MKRFSHLKRKNNFKPIMKIIENPLVLTKGVFVIIIKVKSFKIERFYLAYKDSVR